MIKGFLISLVLMFSFSAKSSLTAEQKTKVEQKLEFLKSWGQDAQVITFLKESETKRDKALLDMNQDKWKSLAVLDPLVRGLTKTPIIEYLKSKKDDSVSEIFINAADGTKLGFLAKTSGWSHKGKAKHDVPMSGKTWIGDLEVDESTGTQQVQVAFPVIEQTKVIGSIVVGLAISQLK